MSGQESALAEGSPDTVFLLSRVAILILYTLETERETLLDPKVLHTPSLLPSLIFHLLFIILHCYFSQSLSGDPLLGLMVIFPPGVHSCLYAFAHPSSLYLFFSATVLKSVL